MKGEKLANQQKYHEIFHFIFKFYNYNTCCLPGSIETGKIFIEWILIDQMNLQKNESEFYLK